MDVDLVLYDVNETLSDLTPLGAWFTRVGLSEQASRSWFAAVLRDGFALAVVGEAAPFRVLAGDALAALLGRRDDDLSGELVATFLALEVHPDVVEGLRTVARTPLRQATLSNGAAEVARSLLARAGALDAVEAVLSVDDAGIWKPAAGAYRYACATLVAEPARTAMVAVHPWDLHGAHRAGLQTVWLDRTGTAPWPKAFTPPDARITRAAEVAELSLPLRARELLAQVRRHARGLEHAAVGHPFLDVTTARSIRDRLVVVLGTWPTLTAAQTALVEATVRYVVDLEDEEHDVASPIGLVDDEEQVTALERALRGRGGRATAPPTT